MCPLFFIVGLVESYDWRVLVSSMNLKSFDDQLQSTMYIDCSTRLLLLKPFDDQPP